MIYQAYSFTVPQEKCLRVITDTDAFNKADDQFAVAQTLLSPKLDNVGLIAVHFSVSRVPDSMERSYGELERICAAKDFPSDGLHFRGANRPLEGKSIPVDSEGARLIIWQVPKNVYEMMAVSLAELECRARPCGRLGLYLFDQLAEHCVTDIPRKSAFRSGKSWVLGDSPAAGLLLYEHRFEYDYHPAPQVSSDMCYIPGLPARPIRVYKRIDSRFVLEDFYVKLALFAQHTGGKL